MNPEFFTNLSSDIFINILSRLPVRNIVRCKCVCKSWLNLLETHEFVKFHLSKSVSGLAIFEEDLFSKLYKIFEFEDAPNLECHDLHYNPVTNFNLPYHGLIQGSANGLLLLRDLRSPSPDALYICNPITRDYIEIHCPQDFIYSYPQVVSFGFGASKMTGQHKVVRIFHDLILDQGTSKWQSIPKSECWVYTVGTGSWKSIAPGGPLVYNCRSIGAVLNGNLHWLVFDLNGSPCISCFDLETELFSIFSPPPPLPDRGRLLGDVFALGDCLCLCDNSSDDEIVIWLMKEYGVEKSWTKEFVISKRPDLVGEYYVIIRPIKVFKDGDILMAWGDFFLFYYSSKSKTIKQIDMFGPHTGGAIDSILLTSSFLSLKSFAIENVRSF